MATTKRGDLLLAISGVGLRVYIGVTALVTTLVLVALGVLVIAPPARIAEELALAPALALPVILVCTVIILATMYVSILFVLQLLRIIATVRDGDPFEPANADRLTRMAWYAFGGTAGSWVASGLAAWLGQHFKGVDIHISSLGSGLALVVTLFILARVFRHGAEMREDLIGTV